MPTDDEDDDTLATITPVDDSPPIMQPVDNDPMPPPYLEILHAKSFFKAAMLPISLAIFIVPAVVLVGVVDGGLARFGLFVLWLVGLGVVVLLALRYWMEWRQRPLSVPDPRSSTMYVGQAGVWWLYPFGMRDSPPDPFRLNDYDLTTPERTFWEQTFFRNSNTLWLLGEDEAEPPKSRQFKDVKDVEAIIAIWEWNRRQEIGQQDEVVDALQEILVETREQSQTLREIRDLMHLMVHGPTP